MMKLRVFISAFLLVLISSTALAQRLSVGVPIANIRSGPGQNNEILWKVEQYYPLVVIEKSGQWYQFKDFEGDKGWIHGSLVRSIPSVITRKEDCNIRSGPGRKFDIVFTVEKGIPFKVIEQKKNWIHIQHADGDKGWIYKSLVW
jgi:SH3-like domain-containing protein